MKIKIKLYVYLCILTIFLATACAVNPVTGKRELSLISESAEISLGQETDVSIRQQYGVYDDPTLTKYVTNIGISLAPHTHRSHLKYHFAVLDTPVINAFAVPGGYIYVTRGILAMMNSEAELAVVLSHELGHVNARHSVRKLSKLLLVQLGLSVGSALNDTFAKLSGAAGIGIQLLFLKYSRDDERQADQLGVEYSRKGKYNPAEMINFFGSLQKLGDLSGGQSLPGFLSTHPLTSERIQNTKNMITNEDKQLNINKQIHLDRINNMIYGDDPRQGFVEGQTFYHPGMRFFFSFPGEWKIQNSPTQVVLVSKDGNGAVILQAEKSTEQLKTYAQKKAQSLEGSQFIRENRSTINGLNSFHQLYDIPQQEKDTLRVRFSFIKKGAYIYTFSALSTSNSFNQYNPKFNQVVASFRELKNQAYLNRKPKRLILTRASGKHTMREIFQNAGISQDDWQKLAILNSLELGQIPKQNQSIKIVR